MTNGFIEIVNPDSVYCLSRAMILGILISSEILLARRMRVRFERHVILFLSCCLLMAAELLGVVLGISGESSPPSPPSHVWVWYPIISTAGVLGLMLWFDFVRSGLSGRAGGGTGVRVRRNARYYMLGAGAIFAVGALMSTRQFAEIEPPTSLLHLGNVAYALHGVRAVVALALLWKAYAMRGKWLSRRESRAYLMGSFFLLAGAVTQVWAGPREPLTSLAFAVFVGVYLRDNYRRTEMDAVLAAEDRSAKTLLLHRVTTQLKSTFDIHKLCEILMESLLANLGAESGAVYLREERDSRLTPVLIQGRYPPPQPLPEALPDDPAELRRLIKETPVPVGRGIVGRVAETGVPHFIYNAEDAARLYEWPTGTVTVHTAIALPIRSPEAVYGVVQIVNRYGGNPFDEEDLRFASLVVEQAGQAIHSARLHAQMVERQRTEQQIKIARDIQLRLIPAELPRIPGVGIAAEYRAAQEVGGDYFDFYRIDHDHVGVVIFDVAGKGVPGALLMAITRTFLKMAAPRSTSPAWVLNEVNAALTAELRRGLFITCAYGVLRLSTLEFALCSAGHTPMLIRSERDGVCRRFKPKGIALGLVRPNRFRAALEQQIIPLQPGDTVVLYTDGVVESMNEDGEEYGEDRLCETVTACAAADPDKLVNRIADSVRGHAGTAEQYDDITIVAIRVGVDTTDATEAS